jgi:hypothetical protein
MNQTTNTAAPQSQTAPVTSATRRALVARPDGPVTLRAAARATGILRDENPRGLPGANLRSARACSSAGERPLHTREVTGSIPVTPIAYVSRFGPSTPYISCFQAVRAQWRGQCNEKRPSRALL